MPSVGIIGAGAWGTALAIAAGRAGADVILQAHEAEVVEDINRNRRNSAFLPNVAVGSSVRATTSAAEAAQADVVLFAVPAQFLRAVAATLKADWPEGKPAVLCAKGIETQTGKLMTEVLAEALPQAVPAVLSGPTFADEVARDLPTALTLAAQSLKSAERLAAPLRAPRFRIYGATDMIGAQIGGAVKNVLAIACGIVAGKELGDNCRAALITRGLAEIARLGAAKGAARETFMGLSGLGDLVLTCNAMQSRNFSLGFALGEGKPLDAVLGARRSVVEGVYSAEAVSRLADALEIEMPIARAVDAVLNRGADSDATIRQLLARRPRIEPAAGDGAH